MFNINYSIIIPHYNIPNLLERLLESTPYDRDDVEIIVVDDRSDRDIDRLLEVRDRFRKLGVYFFRNNNGIKGAGTCRNIGLRHARGKWLLFADADDCFTPNMYNIISQYINCESDMVLFKTESINTRGDLIIGRADNNNKKLEMYQQNSIKKNELLLRFDLPGPVGKIISSELVKKYKIHFEEIPVSNDVMFSAKVGLYANQIEISDRRLYRITEREGSLTTVKDEEKYKLRTRVFIKLCRFLKQNLNSDDWKLLNFNGNIRLIDAYQKGYGINVLMYILMVFVLNGIKPISFNEMSLKTVPITFNRIMKEKKKYDKVFNNNTAL